MAGLHSGSHGRLVAARLMAKERDSHTVAARDDPRLAMSIGDAAKMLGNGAAVLVDVANALAHLAYEAAGVGVEEAGPAEGVLRTLAPLRSQAALVDASTAAGILGISLAALRKRVQRGAFARGVVVYTGRRYQFRRDRLV
jgi:hypothetical protein